MDTASAFMMGAMNRGKETMVFDWDKAARIIKERNIKDAWAGLDGDMEWTGGVIFKNGEIVDNDYTFLASTWATPILVLPHDEQLCSVENIPCYIMEHETAWNSDTKWPQSARDIINN